MPASKKRKRAIDKARARRVWGQQIGQGPGPGAGAGSRPGAGAGRCEECGERPRPLDHRWTLTPPHEHRPVVFCSPACLWLWAGRLSACGEGYGHTGPCVHRPIIESATGMTVGEFNAMVDAEGRRRFGGNGAGHGGDAVDVEGRWVEEAPSSMTLAEERRRLERWGIPWVDTPDGGIEYDLTGVEVTAEMAADLELGQPPVDSEGPDGRA